MKGWSLALGLLVAACFFGPWAWPHGFEEGSLRGAFLACSWAHPFGTDELGRDVMARLFYGGRLSMLLALAATLLSALLGIGLGLAAVSLRARGALLMRATDFMLALPRLPIYIVLLQLLGPGLQNLVLVLVLFGWAPLARLTYGAASSEAGKSYMQAAEGSGGSLLWLARRHLLPNIAPGLAVALSLDLRNRVMVEATLSYLGFGVPAPYPSWGGMIASVQAVLLLHPWALLPPLGALFIFCYSVQELGLLFSRRWHPQRHA